MGVMSHNLCVPLGACPLSPLHVVEHVWQVYETGVGAGAGQVVQRTGVRCVMLVQHLLSLLPLV